MLFHPLQDRPEVSDIGRAMLPLWWDGLVQHLALLNYILHALQAGLVESFKDAQR